MKILLVEDDRAVRDALTRMLSLDGNEVVEATTGPEGMTIARQHRDADVMLLDWMLPGVEGIDVLRQMRAAELDVPVIMLTARTGVAERVAGLESGADDYLTKPFAIEELRARMSAVTRRKERVESAQPAQAQQLTCADLTMDIARHEVRRAGRPVQLSRIEWELLRVLLANAGTVCTRSDLHLQVWDYDFGSDSNTLEVHIGYLRRKLGEPRLIHTVRGFGYILEER
jgi:two-component system response regulator MprA